eukprot:g1539.t1
MPPHSDSSVRVALRIRPLLGEEDVDRCRSCLRCVEDKPQVIMGKDRAYTFDYVFGPNSGDQKSVFTTTVCPLIEAFLAGYNATIVAYGQTGSGKTYTMGSECKSLYLNEEVGIIPRAMREIFRYMNTEKLQNNGSQFLVRVSFLEIYGEEIRDLSQMCRQKQSCDTIQLREKNGEVQTIGCTEKVVSCPDEALAFLENGLFFRTTASTQMNDTSSRSHAIFTLTLDQDLGSEMRRSKFHFVDLAGSERAKRTGAAGLRLRESININTGLLALGNVISALGDEKKRGKVHIPYRDSKLTRLLQSSLGGNSRTLMIACVSPAEINFEETLSTLKYANRARNIKNKPVKNKCKASEVKALKLQIAELKKAVLISQSTRKEENHQRNSREKTSKQMKEMKIMLQSAVAEIQRLRRDNTCLIREVAQHRLGMERSETCADEETLSTENYRHEDIERKENSVNDEVVKELESSLHEKKKLLSELERRTRKYEQLKKDYREKLQRMDLQVRVTTKERDTLQYELSQMKEIKTKEMERLKASLQKSINKKNEELEQLKEKQMGFQVFLKAKNEDQAKISKLEEEMSKIRAQRDEIRRRGRRREVLLHEKRERLEKLKERNRKQEEMLRKMASSMSKRETALRRRTEELHRIRTRMRKMKEKLAKIKGTKNGDETSTKMILKQKKWLVAKVESAIHREQNIEKLNKLLRKREQHCKQMENLIEKRKITDNDEELQEIEEDIENVETQMEYDDDAILEIEKSISLGNNDTADLFTNVSTVTSPTLMKMLFRMIVEKANCSRKQEVAMKREKRHVNELEKKAQFLRDNIKRMQVRHEEEIGRLKEKIEEALCTGDETEVREDIGKKLDFKKCGKDSSLAPTLRIDRRRRGDDKENDAKHLHFRDTKRIEMNDCSSRGRETTFFKSKTFEDSRRSSFGSGQSNRMASPPKSTSLTPPPPSTVKKDRKFGAELSQFNRNAKQVRSSSGRENGENDVWLRLSHQQTETAAAKHIHAGLSSFGGGKLATKIKNNATSRDSRDSALKNFESTKESGSYFRQHIQLQLRKQQKIVKKRFDKKC